MREFFFFRFMKVEEKNSIDLRRKMNISKRNPLNKIVLRFWFFLDEEKKSFCQWKL